jgi:hypothetical protein
LSVFSKRLGVDEGRNLRRVDSSLIEKRQYCRTIKALKVRRLSPCFGARADGNAKRESLVKARESPAEVKLWRG